MKTDFCVCEDEDQMTVCLSQSYKIPPEIIWNISLLELYLTYKSTCLANVNIIDCEKFLEIKAKISDKAFL